jgi:hypothetical protein
MRRLMLLALFAFACTTQPPMVVDRPGVPPPFPGNGAPPGGPVVPASAQCREVGRTYCDTANCGAGMDFVTLNCPDGVERRCETNGRCRTR